MWTSPGHEDRGVHREWEEAADEEHRWDVAQARLRRHAAAVSYRGAATPFRVKTEVPTMSDSLGAPWEPLTPSGMSHEMPNQDKPSFQGRGCYVQPWLLS